MIYRFVEGKKEPEVAPATFFGENFIEFTQKRYGRGTKLYEEGVKDIIKSFVANYKMKDEEEDDKKGEKKLRYKRKNISDHEPKQGVNNGANDKEMKYMHMGVETTVKSIKFYGLDRRNRDLITVSAKDVLLFKEEIKAKVTELAKKGRKVAVVIDGCMETKQFERDERIEYNFENLDLAELFVLNSQLKHLGLDGSIRFNERFEITRYSDLKSCFTFEEVYKANFEIDKIVKDIKKMGLSPYETMLYIHWYMEENYIYFSDNNSFYRRVKNKSNRKNSIVDLHLNRKTNCVGFASMTKAIIDRLNIPQLKCEYITVFVDNGGGHALNLINIDDPEYDLKGVYFSDNTVGRESFDIRKKIEYFPALYEIPSEYRRFNIQISTDERPIRNTRTDYWRLLTENEHKSLNSSEDVNYQIKMFNERQDSLGSCSIIEFVKSLHNDGYDLGLYSIKDKSKLKKALKKVYKKIDNQAKVSEALGQAKSAGSRKRGVDFLYDQDDRLHAGERENKFKEDVLKMGEGMDS